LHTKGRCRRLHHPGALECTNLEWPLAESRLVGGPDDLCV